MHKYTPQTWVPTHMQEHAHTNTIETYKSGKRIYKCTELNTLSFVYKNLFSPLKYLCKSSDLFTESLTTVGQYTV